MKKTKKKQKTKKGINTVRTNGAQKYPTRKTVTGRGGGKKQKSSHIKILVPGYEYAYSYTSIIRVHEYTEAQKYELDIYKSTRTQRHKVYLVYGIYGTQKYPVPVH